MSSSSQTSASSSEEQNFYTMNMSSEDTLAHSAAVSRIQSPTATYSQQNSIPKLDRNLTLTDSSSTYYVNASGKNENDLEIEVADANGKSRSALKKLYRLSQQAFQTMSPEVWNKRSKINDTSNAQNATNDAHIQIELATPTYQYSTEDKKKLIALMSQCLVRYGCPSHRIESSLDQTARFLSVDAAFSYVPGQMMISFGGVAMIDSQTVLIKVHQGYDIKKLADVDDVANALCRSELHVGDCLLKLEEIVNSPPTWGSYGTIVAFTMCSFTACLVMFGGSWTDSAVAGVLGFLVGALNVMASQHSVYSNVFEVSASAAVALISRSLFQWVCFSKVAISAVIVLLPGYSMTVAVMELSARQIAAGTIRFVYSVIYAFILGYGLQIGSSLYGTINPNSDSTGHCMPGVSEWIYIPFLPFLAISIAMTFGASAKQWPSMICCSIIAFVIVFFLNKVISDYQIAASISAFAIGLYANLALKVTKTPPLVPLSCGITLLVPGGIGVRGAYHLLMDDDPDGSAFALHMVVVALGIAVGLFASTMIIYPRSKRRSIYVSM